MIYSYTIAIGRTNRGSFRIVQDDHTTYTRFVARAEDVSSEDVPDWAVGGADVQANIFRRKHGISGSTLITYKVAELHNGTLVYVDIGVDVEDEVCDCDPWPAC